jgi:hypothetical protein
MDNWKKEKYFTEKGYRFMDIVKLDLSFNIEKFIMLLNRNNNLIIKLNKYNNNDNNNNISLPIECNEGNLLNLISNENFDIFYINNFNNPNYYTLENDKKSKSKIYIINNLEVLKINIKIYINIFCELDNEDIKLILQKNSNNINSNNNSNSNSNNNNYNKFNIFNQSNLYNNNTKDENPIKILEDNLNNLTKKLKILSLLINEISQIELNSKKNNNLIKILKKNDDDFDIFKAIYFIKEAQFNYLISDLFNLVNNIYNNTEKDSEIIMKSEFFKHMASIVNQNKNIKLIQCLNELIKINIFSHETFNYNCINNPDFIYIFSYTIIEYKKFNEEIIEDFLTIMRYALLFYKKNEYERYREIIIFLEENKINFIIEEMSTIFLSTEFNLVINLILRENWDVMDLYLQDENEKQKQRNKLKLNVDNKIN